MIENESQREAALLKARGIVTKAMELGRDLTESEDAEIKGILSDAQDFDRTKRQQRGSNLLKAIGASGTSDAVRNSDGTWSQTGTSGDAGTQYLDLGSKAHSESLVRAMSQLHPMGSKALITTGSVVVDIPMIGDLPITLGRPLRSFLQAIPTVVRPASYAWAQQTVRTENADIVSSGDLKPTSVLTLVRMEGKLSVIATLSEPIDKFVLEDATALKVWVGTELTQAVATALEAQVLSGDGTGDNLTGLANTSGIQLFTSSAGNTDKLVEMRKALTKLETVGEFPSVFILNPNDWEGIATKRNTGGEFDLGGAIDAEKRTAWGVPVALSTSLAANSYYLLGDGAANIGVGNSGIQTEWAMPGDMFQRNQVQARTEGRFNLEVVRPKAVLKGTFVTV